MKYYNYLLIYTLLYSACTNTEKHNYQKLKITLEKVYDDDQLYRAANYDYTKQKPLDLKNEKIVTKIIDSIGWIGTDKIGRKANQALYLALQHSNLQTMEKYLPIMKAAVNSGNAEKEDIAFLIDRVEKLNNRKQIYGTQYCNFDKKGDAKIYQMIDPKNVNRRRYLMNLPPLKATDSIFK